MTTQHEVRADLVVDPKNAQRGFEQASASAGRFERSVGSVNSATDGLFKKLLAVGGAYLSFNSAFGVFSRLTNSAIKYTSALEGTKIGLASIMSAVENVPWAEATKMAGAAFERIKKMSITAPGSAQDMFGIFNGIVGPIRAAGAPLETVYTLTNDTMLAAAALGVDFQQASRDINMMSRGAAGVDVKMFSLLHSTGAIKEDTEAWNKNLTGAQRVEKLGAALKKFAGSGEEFGKSWAGVTSTFQGLSDELKRTTFQPLMKAVAASMFKLNDVLDQHGERIGHSFEFLGTSMVRVWDSTLGKLDFDQVMLGIEHGAIELGKAFQTASHWAEALENGWGRLASGVRESLPMLKMLAGLYLGHKVMGMLGGGGGAGAGGALAAAGGGAPATAATAAHQGLLSRAASYFNAGMAAKAAGPVAGFATSEVSSGMNFKKAGLASLMFPPAALGFLFTAALNQFSNTEASGGTAAKDAAASYGGGGGQGAGGGGGAGLGTLINSVSAAIVVTEHWSQINEAFAPIVSDAEHATTQLAESTAHTSLSFARLWGKLEVMAASIGTALMPVVTAATQVLANMVDHVGLFADSMNAYLGPAFDYVISLASKVAIRLTEMLDPLAKLLKVQTNAGWEKETTEYQGQKLDYTMLQKTTTDSDFKAPDARKPSNVTNVNASGARVTIKQEFGNQDPDRVVSLMMLDLERQAESRLTSAFSGAFTR